MENTKIDKTIFEAFLKGDARAFSVIFEEYSPLLYRRIYSVLKDDDDTIEVVQNLFVRLWNNRLHLNITTESFRSYLFKMASSMCIDLLRKNIRTQNVIDTLFYTSDKNESSVEEIYFFKESKEIIDAAIKELPPQRKLIFMLSKIEGKSYAEIAGILNISTSTVSNQLVLATKFVKNFTLKYHQEIKLMIFIQLF